MCIYIFFFWFSDFEDRLKLDRRRLEEAHLKFCVLDVYKRYPEAFPRWVISTSVQQTLEDVTPLYYKAFADKYAGKSYINITFHYISLI